MSTLLRSAKKYKSLGISTIATDANKRAVAQWKPFQDHIATEEELAEMFSNRLAEGIAIVCGAVSAGLEVVDVDCKYDLSGDLFERFMQFIVDDLPEVAGRLVIASTRGGGYHILYRCDTIEGNLKLARRPTTDEERAADPHDKVRVLIETRGEGGYVIAAPTEGYKFIQGVPGDIPTITAEQRAAIHEIARSFNEVVDTVTHHHAYTEQKSYSKSPFQDYNERGDVVELLQRHGWKVVRDDTKKVYFQRPGHTTARTSGDYHRELGYFAVFTTSSQFEPQKGYRPAAVFCMLECNGDWKEAARRLVDLGYGEPYKRVSKDIKKFIRREREDGTEGEPLAAKVANKFGRSIEEAQGIISSVDREDEVGQQEWWTFDPESEKIGVKYTRFARFLEKHGFGLYFPDPASPIFKLVHNDHGRLEEATPERIKKFTQEYIQSFDLAGVEFTTEQLLEVVYRNNNLFSDGLFEFLQPVRLDFLRDTAEQAYFPFQNGIVEVTAKGAALRSYGDVNKVIWKSSIINHHIDLDYMNVGADEDPGCEFLDFLNKALGQDPDRVMSACSIIGYLLHKFKNPGRPYAVVIGEETEDEALGGGTGKGLLMKAVEHMLNVVTVDGKTFNPDKPFAWQRVQLDTNIVVIQDATKAFSITSFNAVITEGMTVEKKNKDELFLKYPDAPKIVITTNYGMRDDSNHAKRRSRLIEMSNYFSPKHTPFDEYGHLLFDDWDRDEWNRFYNFMFWCVQLYLEKGIIELPQGDRYKLKKIKGQFGEDFTDWWQYYISNGCETETELTTQYQNFLNINSFDKKDYSMKRFSLAIRAAAENFGHTLHIRKCSQSGGKRFVRVQKHTESKN